MSRLKNEFRNHLNVVILCAGEGTRLENLTLDLPKPLLKIRKLNNKPILQNTIETLENLGIQNIHVVKGHLGQKIEDFVQSLQKNVRIIDAKERYKKGPLHSLLSFKIVAEKHLLIIPGDTIFPLNTFVQIFELLESSFQVGSKNAIIFYRKTKIEKLITKKRISILNCDKVNSNRDSNEILQVKIQDLDIDDQIFQVIPIFFISANFAKKLPFSNVKDPKISNKITDSFKTLKELINYCIKSNNEILNLEIDEDNEFFDIDYKEDIDNFDKIEFI